MTDALEYLLDYFQVRRPWDINMIHGVNEKIRFKSYVNNPSVHMFEVDIEDNVSSIEGIVLKHGGIGDVPFIWAIKQLVEHKKALKLDIKIPKGKSYIPEFYEYVLDLLREHWDPDVPLWINADVLKGPNWESSNHEHLDPLHFIPLYNAYHEGNPNTMLSLGYSTNYIDKTSAQSYTSQMLEEMDRIIKNVKGLVTVSLGYTNLMVDINFLHQFLELGSVTIWNSVDRISHDHFTELANYTANLQVFKDLTGEDKNPIWN